MSTEHPFQPGVRVAVQQADHSFREDFVHKVHKNGNFTLKSDPRRQYRASEPRAQYYESTQMPPWYGWPCGTYASRDRVYLWNDENQAMIDKGNAQADLNRRRQAVINATYRLRPNRMNPTALKLFEEAIAALDPLPDPKP